MAKTSTEKGKRGEQEVVRIARSLRLTAQRTAPLQAGRNGGADVEIRQAPRCHVEVKRDQRMSVDAMVRQATRDAGLASEPSFPRHPVVLWRRNNQPWRADIPMALFFELLRGYDA